MKLLACHSSSDEPRDLSPFPCFRVLLTKSIEVTPRGEERNEEKEEEKAITQAVGEDGSVGASLLIRNGGIRGSSVRHRKIYVRFEPNRDPMGR